MQFMGDKSPTMRYELRIRFPEVQRTRRSDPLRHFTPLREGEHMTLKRHDVAAASASATHSCSEDSRQRAGSKTQIACAVALALFGIGSIVQAQEGQPAN